MTLFILCLSCLSPYNEAGEELIQNIGESGIDPWRLVETDSSGDRISKMNTVKRTCKLCDGVYTVEIGAKPGNMNIQGRCGAHISAWVTIHKGNKLLIRIDLEGDCHDIYSPIITRILWRVGAKEPEIMKKSLNDFYQ